MNKRNYIILALISICGIISRIPFTEKFQSHWDGPQYSIAIFRYSLEQQTPATPGYPLYIAMGWLVNLVLHDPHKSLLVMSVLFLVLGSILIFFLSKEMSNRVVGFIAAVLYLTSPVLYFFSLTAYAYGINVVMVLFLATVVYRAHCKRLISGTLMGIVASLLIGVRPQELLLVWSLLLLGFISLKKEKLLFIFSFTLTTLIWLIPFIFIAGVGDFTKFIFPGGGSNIPPFSLSNMLAVKEPLIKGLYLTVGLGAVSLLYYLVRVFRRRDKTNRRQVAFFTTWILPPLLFNLFIRSDHAGYQLTYLSGLLVLVSYALYKMFFFSRPLLYLIVFFLALANLYTFFRDRDPGMMLPYVPTSFHLSEIRKNDIRMGQKQTFIRDNFRPRETLIIIGDYNLFRPVMYHLPEYSVIQINALTEGNERFREYVREGKKYNMKELRRLDQTIVVSQATKKIVIFDDESSTWRVSDSEILKLPYNTYMTIIENHEKSTYKYGYTFFEKR